MAYVLRDGQGSLFRNENKTADNHPNARGELMIDGVLYEISAWTKQGKKGAFQSLSVKRKEARQSQPRQQQHESDSYSHSYDPDPNSIPF